MNFRSVASSVVGRFLSLVIFGAGAWALHATDRPDGEVLFEESFTEAPGSDCSWLREIPGNWKMDRERKELLIRPVWSEGNMKNIPLWKVPDLKEGPIAIEVHVHHEPVGDYEYAGLLWYYDDQNFVAIRKGPHGEDGKILSLVQRTAGKGDGPLSAPKNVLYQEPEVDLRLVIAGAKAQGWYRASSADPWHSLGEVELPGSGGARVGFRTGNGEAKPSWARFSKFRILRLGPGH